MVFILGDAALREVGLKQQAQRTQREKLEHLSHILKQRREQRQRQVRGGGRRGQLQVRQSRAK